jgi:hypothetical protein
LYNTLDAAPRLQQGRLKRASAAAYRGPLASVDGLGKTAFARLPTGLTSNGEGLARMKLKLQNTQKIGKLKHKAKAGGQKRIRRKAPLFTLVWSEEVQALRTITTKQVKELRAKAMWRIELAEAALSGDAAVVKLGSQAHETDLVWSKFQVGEHWFCLDFRPAQIREYVVNLAQPPSPDDIPPGGGSTDASSDDDSAIGARGGRYGKQESEGSTSALVRTLESALQAAITARQRAITAWRHPKLALNATISFARDVKLRSTLLQALSKVRRAYRNLSYRLTELRAWAQHISRKIVSTIATGRISFTRLRELPVAHFGVEARLEPRCVGQNSGIRILLYSWIMDEHGPIDWTADLFGVVPVDWAANLFGVLPEEERAFR